MAWKPLTRESIAETQELISATIALSRDTFRASAFLAQGQTGFFCEAAPRDRKACLAQIVGLSDWDAHLERARLEKRQVEDELARIAGQVEQAEGELMERSLIEQERESARVSEFEMNGLLNDATARHASAREALAHLEQWQRDRASAQREVERAEGERLTAMEAISHMEARIKAADERIAAQSRLQEIVDDLPGLLSEQEALQAASLQWTRQQELASEREAKLFEISRLVEEASELDDRAERVLSHVGQERCDRCDQVLGADAAERAAQSYKAEGAMKRLRSIELAGEADLLAMTIAGLPGEMPNMDRLATLPELIRNAQQAEQQIAALVEVAAQKNQILLDLTGMVKALPERDAAVLEARAAFAKLPEPDAAEVARLGREIGELNIELQRLPNLLRDATSALARCEERLERLDKIAAGITRSMTRRDELQEELIVLTHLEKACGPNGVPALILENVAIPQIEVEASRVLARLGGPAYGVELRTLRETKSGTIADALDIVCLTATGDAPYESFSGGERARIAFALRLALAQLLANRKGSATGLLIIDEIEGLDGEGIAALVDVLEELQAKIPKVIIVSHNAELRDAFESTLLLENVDGRSRVVEKEAV